MIAIDIASLAAVTGGTARPVTPPPPHDPNYLRALGLQYGPGTDPYSDRFRAGGGHDWTFPTR